MRIVILGNGIYTDTCRRRLDHSPKTSICLAGNGWYNETVIDRYFTQTNWFGGDPASAERVGQVRFACMDLTGKKPEVARLVFPRFAEWGDGRNTRIEIPCDSTRDQIAHQMKTITVLLSGLSAKDRAPLIDQVDQVRSVCSRQDTQSKTKCETMRILAGKVFASQIKDEEVPSLTLGGIQLVSGLNQAPPQMTAPQSYQTKYFEELRKVEQALTRVLPSCGLSLSERTTPGKFNGMLTDPQAIAAPDMSKIRWKACLDEIERQKKELERQRVKIEPGNFIVDGKNLQGWDAMQSEDPRVKKAVSLSMRGVSTQIDLAQDMVRKKDIPGNKSDWEETVRQASFMGAIICPRNGRLGGGIGMMTPSGSADEISALARQMSVNNQVFEAAQKQPGEGCVSVTSVRVTSAGHLEFTFAPASNPYGNSIGGEIVAPSLNDGAAGAPVEDTF